MRSISVASQSDIAAARRIAAVAARGVGFDEVDEGRVALAATELAGNLFRHAKGGELLVQAGDEEVPTIELLALDRGPGIADVAACLRDGFSTAGTPGTGLGAIRRLSEAFDIHSMPGAGTVVLARLRRERLAIAPQAAGMVTCGAVNLAKPGEDVCGDAWAWRSGKDVAALFVADGLGHGPLAADASRAAVGLFRRAPFAPPVETLQAVHAGLRSTRGAAVAVARLDLATRDLAFGGIGNVSGALLGGGEMRRMLSLSGTAGYMMPRIREFHYPVAGACLLVMCSDGLLASWSLDRYPDILAREPLVIAGVLYRDFNRGRDDVTVAVLKAAMA